jgi:hypothetical protein
VLLPVQRLQRVQHFEIVGDSGHVIACVSRLSSRKARLPGSRMFSIDSIHIKPFNVKIVPNQDAIMAEPSKQATIYIVDLGSTMGDCHNGRTETDLDYGMRYIWDKIATTMAANLKGGNLGVLGLRTDETNNPLDEDGYENLSVSIPSE